MAKERKDIAEYDKWNVQPFFSSVESWWEEFQNLTAGKTEEKQWPELQVYRGRLGEGAATLSQLLQKKFYIARRLMQLYTYAHLRHDEDMADESHKNMFTRISLLYCDFEKEISWIQPEILQLTDLIWESYLKDERLQDYFIYLKKLFTLKPYTLSVDKENLLALAQKPFKTPEAAFGAFNNIDLKLGEIEDEEGRIQELTHGTYGLYLQSQDRTLRRNSVLQLHQKYEEFENTIVELINGQVLMHLFTATARHYPSCLHAALVPHQISVEIYHNLIATVRKNLSIFHRYICLRKNVLGVDQFHFYDLYVPLEPPVKTIYSFAEAEQMVLESIRPLGEEYYNILQRGLERERWVDRFENKNKRSGAYSGGCYDSFPYILMNYQGSLRDVMTLAHEAGHSMHSYYSNRCQSFEYAHYPIFVAEVASTFNEELLFRMLLERAKSKQERCYLLNQRIHDICVTLIRQTQFAEFELLLHTMAEQDIPITAASLKEAYHKLHKDYYGSDFYIDPEIDVEYLRIPHFYYNFYVYQYATGISAAHALVERFFCEGEQARRDYLHFLSAGSSCFPIDLLKIAGVDMRQSAPIQILFDRLATLIVELENIFESGVQ